MPITQETKSAITSLIVSLAQFAFMVFGICYGIAAYRNAEPFSYLNTANIEIQEEERLVEGLVERMDTTEGRELLRQILMQRSAVVVLGVLNRRQLCILYPEIDRRISELYGTPAVLDSTSVLRKRLDVYYQRCASHQPISWRQSE